jgi:hypothetical protein
MQISKPDILLYWIFVLHVLVGFVVLNQQCMVMNHFKNGHPLFSYLLLRANYFSLSLLFNRTVNVRVSNSVIFMLVMINKDF